MVAIQPLPNESCEDFCIRAHSLLSREIPDSRIRNSAVWNAWDQSRGADDRESAREKFANYRWVPEVCHFTEHAYRNKLGQMVAVGPNELAEVCKNLNHRAEEVSLFPALIDRHTKDNPGRDDPEPEIVGYAGAFRIGMIGKTKQRYAIFGDEYHKPDRLREIAGKPRRSVEYLPSKKFFDPIACLGADSPGLEIPPAYYSARSDEEGEVIRYSIVAPAYPGSSGTYITGFEPVRHEASEIDSADDQRGLEMLEQQDIEQIVDAFMQTPQMQFVTGLMNQQQTNQQPGMQPAGQPNGQPGGQPFQPSGGPPNPLPDDNDEDDQMNGAPKRYSNGEIDEISQKYSALASSYEDLVQRHSVTNMRLANLERERTDAVRSSRLQSLAGKFPVVDLDEELPKVLYSAGATMSDDEFEKYVATVERFAARTAPLTRMVPGGQADDGGVIHKERYSERVQSEVVRRITAAVDRGQVPPDYEETEYKVMADLGITK